MTALPTGSVLGILGGGQLGRMTALAAAPLGYDTHIFSPGPGPATQVTPHATIAAYDDTEALAAFADAVDVVTYEFENVPGETAAFLAERVPVRPGPKALQIAQHRIREKSFLADIGVPTARWAAAYGPEDVARHADALGGPCVLKTARGGYDGKGQTVVRSAADGGEAWGTISGGRDGVEGILEAFVDFAFEASVVVARGLDGQIAAYDLVENRHRDHILHTTIVPAEASEAVRAEADRIARTIIDALDYVGVLAIEMFITASGEVLVNELAPRPHNSGHWTIDGAITSQFEQVVRACMGRPLGSAARRGNVEMVNLIGDDIEQVPALLARPDVKMHLYGKADARPGRKMGHYTRVF